MQVEYDEKLPLAHELKYPSPHVGSPSTPHSSCNSCRAGSSPATSWPSASTATVSSSPSAARTVHGSSTTPSRVRPQRCREVHGAVGRRAGQLDHQSEVAAQRRRQEQDPRGRRRVPVPPRSGGFITFHHVPTLKPLFTINEPDNSIHTVDYSPLGRLFATGGKDFHVRVYDDGTPRLTQTPRPYPSTSPRPGGTTWATIIASSQ
jgi:WD40 repeat protein